MRAHASWQRFSISHEEIAPVILTGVTRNKPIITVTLPTKVMWWLACISATFVLNFVRQYFRKWRGKIRMAERG